MAEMTPLERIMTALKGGIPDRVPCAPNLTRWARYHHGCTCPLHVLKVGEEFGFDPIVQYGAYTWQSVSNDYVYTPGGGYSYAVGGVYGDLPDVDLEMRVENTQDHVWYYRKFHTPAGDLRDVIQWARQNVGYGDGPNPHRVEPLVKSTADLEALSYLYPPPRRDMISDIPIMLEQVGDRALLVAVDGAGPGVWGMEALGPEGMLLASVEDEELLVGVCRLAQDVHLRNLKGMLEQGMKVVYDSLFQLGPSVGWSPRTFQTIFLPLVKESVELAHQYGALFIYQDDGKMKDIIPHVVEVGVDCVSGLQPPGVGDVILKDAKEQFGRRVSLYGGLDPCYTFDMGSTEDVREAVRMAILDAGEGGGYILGTAEAVDPAATPPENLHAMSQAAREFGTYRPTHALP